MIRTTEDALYRCDLCHRTVDAEMRDRARYVWQPMIICEHCVREPETNRATAADVFTAAAAG